MLLGATWAAVRAPGSQGQREGRTRPARRGPQTVGAVGTDACGPRAVPAGLPGAWG